MLARGVVPDKGSGGADILSVFKLALLCALPPGPCLVCSFIFIGFHHMNHYQPTLLLSIFEVIYPTYTSSPSFSFIQFYQCLFLHTATKQPT